MAVWSAASMASQRRREPPPHERVADQPPSGGDSPMTGPTRLFLQLATMLVLAITRVAPAQAQATADSAVLSDQVIDAGRAIFHGNGTCHACHGDDLQGGAIAPSLRGPKWR